MVESLSYSNTWKQVDNSNMSSNCINSSHSQKKKSEQRKSIKIKNMIFITRI